ncbi:MAG TPA: hypothetical protein VFQ43_20315 [Nitrososphaera sp.]|nr:hypothetical protein [Nitrososphaera sp.]
MSLTACGWWFKGLGYGQIAGVQRERVRELLGKGSMLAAFARFTQLGSTAVLSPFDPDLAVEQISFICGPLTSQPIQLAMAKVAIEDLSGTTTPVTSNPYDGLISACHDDPVRNGRVLRRVA